VKIRIGGGYENQLCMIVVRRKEPSQKGIGKKENSPPQMDRHPGRKKRNLGKTKRGGNKGEGTLRGGPYFALGF